MDGQCEKCTELWRAYAAATTGHVRLLKQQETAARSDPSRYKEFAPAIEMAASERDAARINVEAHIATDHPDEPGAK